VIPEQSVLPASTASTPPQRSRWWLAAAVVGGGLVGAVAGPIIAVPVLGSLGFGSAGVVAGSFAAGIQTVRRRQARGLPWRNPREQWVRSRVP
jgi:hypothetical protein